MSDKPKYKHTTYFRKSDIENIGDSIWTPTIKDWRDVVEDYIEISKKRKNNKFAMFKLQMAVLGDIILLNDTLKGYIKLVEDPEERAVKFPDKDITEINIKFWEQEIKTEKILIQALKDIGDGIAWRVLNYDRSLIYNMCVNSQDPGPITLNNGLLTELNSLSDFTNDPEVSNFIFHAITNFLLISDLTVSYKNGEINFVEVKGGKNPRGKSWKKRLGRQKVRVENIVNIGNKSQGESSNVKVNFKSLESKPKTLLSHINTLLKTVKNKYVVTRVYNSYEGISIVNFANAKDNISFKDNFDRLAKQLTKKENDLIIYPNSVGNLVFSPNRAPLSVHPFASADIANIQLGRYMIFYFFNVSQFIREIEKHGWKVFDLIYQRKNYTEPSMFSVKKDMFAMKVPPALTARAIYEGLAVKSIVQIFEDSFRKGPTKSDGYVFYSYEKEKYLWN